MIFFLLFEQKPSIPLIQFFHFVYNRRCVIDLSHKIANKTKQKKFFFLQQTEWIWNRFFVCVSLCVLCRCKTAVFITVNWNGMRNLLNVSLRIICSVMQKNEIMRTQTIFSSIPFDFIITLKCFEITSEERRRTNNNNTHTSGKWEGITMLGYNNKTKQM